MDQKRVDVIIPTYKPDQTFRHLVKRLTEQTYPINRILVMNTEEAFWDHACEELASQLEVHHIIKAAFDHGGTRNAAAQMSDADILLFMTQDALPKDKELVSELVKALEQPAVKAAYARQLPASDCQLIERYTRSFNYPQESHLQAGKDLATKGIKTYFCSNVCAAYVRETYQELGGFVTHTIFNEDMIFAGQLIQQGYQIAYAAKARVIHSHNYGNIQQFKRNFDLAVSQADHPEIFAGVKSEGEGIRLVKRTASYLLAIGKPWLLISLVMKSGCKYAGYWCGKHYRMWPRKVILAMTMNKSYWT